jgi:hypothetical protein
MRRAGERNREMAFQSGMLSAVDFEEESWEKERGEGYCAPITNEPNATRLRPEYYGMLPAP